jgi:hypothetical protein
VAASKNCSCVHGISYACGIQDSQLRPVPMAICWSGSGPLPVTRPVALASWADVLACEMQLVIWTTATRLTAATGHAPGQTATAAGQSTAA